MLPDGAPDQSFGTDGYTQAPYVPAGQVLALPVVDVGVVAAVERYPLKAPYVPRAIVFRRYSAAGLPVNGPAGPEAVRFNLAAASGSAQFPAEGVVAGPGDTVQIIVAGNHGLVLYRLRAS